MDGLIDYCVHVLVYLFTSWCLNHDLSLVILLCYRSYILFLVSWTSKIIAMMDMIILKRICVCVWTIKWSTYRLRHNVGQPKLQPWLLSEVGAGCSSRSTHSWVCVKVNEATREWWWRAALHTIFHNKWLKNGQSHRCDRRKSCFVKSIQSSSRDRQSYQCAISPHLDFRHWFPRKMMQRWPVFSLLLRSRSAAVPFPVPLTRRLFHTTQQVRFHFSSLIGFFFRRFFRSRLLRLLSCAFRRSQPEAWRLPWLDRAYSGECLQGFTEQWPWHCWRFHRSGWCQGKSRSFG